MTTCTRPGCNARVNRQFTNRHRSGRIFTTCENGHVATSVIETPEPIVIIDIALAASFEDDDDWDDAKGFSFGLGR